MKRALHGSMALLALSAAAFGQTEADRSKGVEYLKKTRDGVEAAVKGLSDAQFKYKAAPERWSVAETLEHIAKSEDLMFQNVAQQVMKSPAGPAGRDTAKLDGMVLMLVPDRSRKAEAPAPLVPTSAWSPAETLEHFLQARAKTIAYLENTQGLRDHATDSPLGQPLDGYEWLLFIAAHSERHTKQMLEVKADAGFPKK
jgi:hypothetical protein